MRHPLTSTLIMATVLSMALWATAPGEPRTPGTPTLRGACNNRCGYYEPCPDYCASADGGHCRSQTGYDCECVPVSPCAYNNIPECDYPYFCTPSGDMCPDS